MGPVFETLSSYLMVNQKWKVCIEIPHHETLNMTFLLSLKI